MHDEHTTQTPIPQLVLLTLVRQLPGIRRDRLMQLALDSLTMDYFTLTEALAQLLDKHLIVSSVRKDERGRDAAGKPVERCDLTAAGQTVCHTLQGQLPPSLVRWLEQAATAEQRSEKQLSECRGEVEVAADGTAIAVLTVRENRDELLTVRLRAPSPASAKKAVNRWPEVVSELYPQLISQLLAPDEPPASAAERPADAEDRTTSP